MSWRIANLTLDTLADLPPPCRGCVFWELGPLPDDPPLADRSLEKESWLSRALLEWGGCGKLGYLDEAPAGYVLYAPPSYLAGAAAFPTSPVSPDAVLLAAVTVVPPHTAGGLGRLLVQAAAEDLARRGVRAIETYGRVGAGERRYGGGEADSGGYLRAAREWSADEPGGCVAPAGFFAAVGFKTIRPHPRYPRLRMELRPGPAWRAEFEQAMEQLREWGSGRPVPGLPAGLVTT